MSSNRKKSKNTNISDGILTEMDEARCNAITLGLKAAAERWAANSHSGSEARKRMRSSLIESNTSDPFGFERMIGKSDFVSINFLSRGVEAAKSVCRIRVPSADGGWFGTGFMVAPGLLVTNNHVLSTREEANQAEAEFGYEHDIDGVIKDPIQFNLAPSKIFYTDIEHDITFVAVVGYSEGGVPLDTFGYLPLLPLSGKALDGEWVTIAQHPKGEPKQMTIRANRIFEITGEATNLINTDRFIHYRMDTQPGSSGSPVLNDQWQVVAVHHKAIPCLLYTSPSPRD